MEEVQNTLDPFSNLKQPEKNQQDQQKFEKSSFAQKKRYRHSLLLTSILGLAFAISLTFAIVLQIEVDGMKTSVSNLKSQINQSQVEL